jgi:hypothetical protein
MHARLMGLVAVVMAAGAAVAAQSSPGVPRPAPGDVKGMLFEIGNSMGMLRSPNRTSRVEDSIVTLELWAKGTMTVNGQASDIPEYRASLNYVMPGLREDLTRTTPTGKSRQVQVVGQTFAWNETTPGMNPTPAPPQAVRERLVQLWTTPMGIYKAAAAAGEKAKVAPEGGMNVLTFPLPAPVSDVTVRATLSTDPKHLIVWHDLALPGLVGTYIVRAQTLGVVTDTTYAEYGDWNWNDYKSDVMLPRRIVQRRADGTVLDLTVTNTNTYNPYVVMPVPPAIRTSAR